MRTATAGAQAVASPSSREPGVAGTDSGAADHWSDHTGSGRRSDAWGGAASGEATPFYVLGLAAHEAAEAVGHTVADVLMALVLVVNCDENHRIIRRNVVEIDGLDPGPDAFVDLLDELVGDNGVPSIRRMNPVE